MNNNCKCGEEEYAMYYLEGIRYCPWCLIEKLSSKGIVFLNTLENGEGEVIL